MLTILNPLPCGSCPAPSQPQPKTSPCPAPSTSLCSRDHPVSHARLSPAQQLLPPGADSTGTSPASTPHLPQLPGSISYPKSWLGLSCALSQQLTVTVPGAQSCVTPSCPSPCSQAREQILCLSPFISTAATPLPVTSSAPSLGCPAFGKSGKHWCP